MSLEPASAMQDRDSPGQQQNDAPGLRAPNDDDFDESDAHRDPRVQVTAAEHLAAPESAFELPLGTERQPQTAQSAQESTYFLF
jgi:hypothetical protein